LQNPRPGKGDLYRIEQNEAKHVALVDANGLGVNNLPEITRNYLNY
jgi:hypothetical protein